MDTNECISKYFANLTAHKLPHIAHMLALPHMDLGKTREMAISSTS